MVSVEELLRIDPALRVACAIGEQSGIPKEVVTRWYGDLILDEITLEGFFLRIGSHVSDPGLRQQFEAVKASLPVVGRSGATVAGAPVVSEP